jgi:Glycosyl hydrolases family 16
MPTSSITHRGRRRWWAFGLVVAAVSSGVLAGAGTVRAAADLTFQRTSLTATVSDATVTVGTTIAGSATVQASRAGVCARDAAGVNRDFPMGSARISVAGTALSATARLPPGRYRYFSCLLVDGRWYRVGADQSFTVATSSGPSPAEPPAPSGTPPTAGAAPGGVPLPTGDLPGWTSVFAEDFTANVAQGSFPGPYAATWMSYHGFADTYRGGDYNQGIISVQNGALDLFLHSRGGRPQVAAPIPLVDGKWGGQTYGRFSVRFSADPVAGYKAAWLLWPDSNNWADGEIDFPEGALDGTLWGFHHCVGRPTSNCHWFDTKVGFTGWHTATIEWSPGRIVYLLDDVVVGNTTNRVPTGPMHWVLQTETDHVADTATSGHVLIDWVTIHRYTP